MKIVRLTVVYYFCQTCFGQLFFDFNFFRVNYCTSTCITVYKILKFRIYELFKITTNDYEKK